MQNYPIFVDLKQQPCLVVGGGPVALRKIRLQLMAGAKITVIAPTLCNEFGNDIPKQIEHLEREFQDSDISGYRLITAATDDQHVNARISQLALAANVPVNVVDQPELCSFITPAIVDRSPVLVAISTGGAAPVLARQIRGQLETLLSPSVGKLASLMQVARARALQLIPDESKRRKFWEQVVNGDIRKAFEAGRDQDAQSQFESMLQNANKSKGSLGDVSLVGAGPGDPDLLTFKALRLMQQADVILHDRLVSDEVLNLCRRDAQRIYVGKQRDEHAIPQQKINELLLELAQSGERVVRLKGGDPFIFGRGGEEIELLAEHNIPFQIVPGVTAASGCATYAGIPLTHRDHAQACMFVTGHLKNGSVDLNWPTLAASNQTLVIYMGLVGLPVICNKLVEHGMPSDMPIALIEKGTTTQQRIFSGTLETLPQKIAEEKIHAPTLIIVGTVVTLQNKLSWFQP